MSNLPALLEGLNSRMRSLSAVEQALVKKRVIKILKDAGLKRPTEIVDAALHVREQKNEKDTREVFPSVQPWPEPVDDEHLLDELVQIFRRYRNP